MRIAPKNDSLVRLASCKAYGNKQYPMWLTLYGQYSKKLVGKSGFHLSLFICAVEKVTLNRYPVVTWCIWWTDFICSVHQEPSCRKVASIWAYNICAVYSEYIGTIYFSPSIPKFTDLMCSVHQDPSLKKSVFHLSLRVQYI